MSDSYKKIKHNRALTTISIDGDVEAISNKVVSLIIQNNQTINSLTNLKALSYLKLVNTTVGTITNCKWLTALIVHTNDSLDQLHQLDQLTDVTCVECSELVSIDLEHSAEVLLDTCPKLQSLVVPTCKLVVLKHCDALNVLEFGTNLKCLSLFDINLVHRLELPIDIQLDLLELSNCDRLYLSHNAINCKQVTLHNCPAITSLDMPLVCESIHIDSCDNLLSVGGITADTCQISKCHRLIDIVNAQIDELVINYCANMCELYTEGISQVRIDHCTTLKRVIIAKDTQATILNECLSLSTIHTEPLPFGVIRNQSIALIGTFAIDTLHNLFASKLTIINNRRLIDIDTIHDLTSLKLINCSQLEMISNSVISKHFVIKNCRNLHTIADIIAPINITLVNLPKLTVSRFIFTAVQSLIIKHCKQLVSSFAGQWIRNLTLINTDIITIVGLADTAIVQVSNSKYLPEINVDPLDSSNDPLAGSAQLKNYIGMRVIAIDRIVNAIRKHQIKSMKVRLTNALKPQDCAICLLEIVLSERFVSKCFHTFHSECIFKWVRIRNACPLCNAPNLY